MVLANGLQEVSLITQLNQLNYADCYTIISLETEDALQRVNFYSRLSKYLIGSEFYW